MKEIRASYFDSTIDVITIFPNDPDYISTYKPIFDKIGFGCYVPQLSAILIDAGSPVYGDPDIEAWIEAHEVGHYHLGHNSSVINQSEEIEADLYAYNLLKGTAAADLIVEKFPERHGVSFSEKMFNDFLEMIVV